MAEDTVNKIGTGIDFYGGQQTIAEMREIVALMQQIKGLSASSSRLPSRSGGPSGSSGQSRSRAAKQEADEIITQEERIFNKKRETIQKSIALEKERQRFDQYQDTGQRAINADKELNAKRRIEEVNNRLIAQETRSLQQIAERQRQSSLNDKINERAQIRAEQIRRSEEQAALREQQVQRARQATRDKVSAINSRTFPTNAEDEIARQRGFGRGLGRDTDSVSRQQVADNIRGLREYRQEQKRASQELIDIKEQEFNRLENIRLREEQAQANTLRKSTQARQQLANIPRSEMNDQTYAQLTGRLNPADKIGLEEDLRRAEIAKRQALIESEKVKVLASDRTRAARQAAQGQLNGSLYGPQEIPEVKAAQEAERLALSRAAKLPRGGSSSGPNLKDPQGLLNDKGFFTTGDALGRITRNILLYEVVSRATYGLVDYIGKSIEAAKKTVEFANALRFATQEAHGNLEENNRLVESIRPLGLSRQQGRQAVTEAARFTESRPQDIGRLTSVALDIAAERGGGIDKTDELIEQLRRRESKFYKRIFDKTTKEIYQDQAETIIRQRPNLDRSTVIGEDKGYYKTQKQEIDAYVKSMTDAQKENAALNYILSQAGKFQGEAALRAQTLAGRIDRIKASFANAQEGVGLFITEIRPLNDLFESLAKNSGALDALRGPEVGRSGPGGSITDEDIRAYGVARTTGFRANALDFINQNGTNILSGGALLGAAALYGRRPATEQFRRGLFDQRFDENVNSGKFGQDLGAARSDAIEFAKSQKPGLIRTIRTGLVQVTSGIDSGVKSLLSETAAFARGVKDELRPSRTLYGPNGLVNPILGGINSPSTLLQAAYQGRRSFGRPGQIYLPKISDIDFEGYTAREGEGLTERGYNQRSARLAQEARTASFRAGGSQAGAIAGGIAGAEVGAFVATSINANSIVATTLTIVGGVVGTAVGSSLGAAAGSTLAGGLGQAVTKSNAGGAAALGLIAAGTGFAIGSYIDQNVKGFHGYQEAQDTNKLNRTIAEQPAFQQKAREELKAQQEDRIRFRSNNPQDILAGKYQLTAAEVNEKIKNSNGLLNAGDFQKIIILQGELLGYAKTDADLAAARAKFMKDTKDSTGETLKYAQNAFAAEHDLDYVNSFISKARDEAQTHFEQSDVERLRKEQIQHDKDERLKQDAVNQQANALNKLRDADQGSFRAVEEISRVNAGPNNDFVKVLSDQATAAERMRQQWGFLGQSTVDYFTKLEAKSTTLQVTTLKMESLVKVQQQLNQVAKESDERNGPGFSTRQQLEAESVGSAINAYQAKFAGAKRISDITGIGEAYFSDNVRTGKDQLADLGRFLSRGTFSTGSADAETTVLGGQTPDAFKRLILGPGGSQVTNRSLPTIGSTTVGEESSRLVRRAVTDAQDQVLNQFSLKQIQDDPGLRSAAIENARSKARIAQEDYQDSIQKAQIQERESRRTRDDLAKINDPRFVQDRLAAGEDPQNIRDLVNRQIVARTDGIPVKDLSGEDFQNRQAAQIELAQQEALKNARAEQAVKEGLAYQKVMTDDIAAIREKIVGGDLAMLIQVQNDTQARADQRSLQDSNPKFKVALDQGAVKVNPYASSFARYSRGGTPK